MNETFTPAELTKIHADLAACEIEAAINEAARKVADASLELFAAYEGHGDEDEERRLGLIWDDAVREYRALTEEKGKEKEDARAIL